MLQKNYFLVLLIYVSIYIFSSFVWSQQQLMVIGWNAESGDADPDFVADQIESIDGCDIWGLCEVTDATCAAQFEAAAAVGENAAFSHILGTTGDISHDYMQIIYDSDRLELLDSLELHRINVSGTVRAPLVAHFRIRGTNIDFLFMINHLYRSRTERRHEQAMLLNLWASRQTLPIIAVGDYNFDWDVDLGDFNHDRGYDEMVSGGHFNWIRPRKLMKTQASPDYDSVR